jgi:hypothetical protein
MRSTVLRLPPQLVLPALGDMTTKVGFVTVCCRIAQGAMEVCNQGILTEGKPQYS